MTQLPVLKVEVEGRIVESNFNEFREQAQLFIKSVNTTLATDEDFAQAKQDIKTCKNVEKQLSTLAKDILKKSKGINDIVSGLGEIENQIKTVRLNVDKAVGDREKIIKQKICQDAADELNDFVAVNNKMLEPFSIRFTFGKDTFSEAAKNKKTKASFEKAVIEERDKYKQVIMQDVRTINENKNWFDTHAYEYEFLFDNLPAIIGKDAEDFQSYVNGRINNYKLSQQEQTQVSAHNPQDPLNAGSVIQQEPITPQLEPIATEPVYNDPGVVPPQNSEVQLLNRWVEARRALENAKSLEESLRIEVVSRYSGQGLGVFESEIPEYRMRIIVENTPAAEIAYDYFFGYVIPKFHNSGYRTHEIAKIVLKSDAYMRLPQELRNVIDRGLLDAKIESTITIKQE